MLLLIGIFCDHRFLKQTTSSLLVVTGLLLTVAIFCKNMSDSRDSLLEETRRDDVIKPPQITPAHHISWSRCQQNMSVANVKNFSTLPDHIKDFLYYRHCRHFPMLLDIPDKCGGAEGSSDVFLLLVIKSAPVNYDRREVLRKTWAKERLQNGVWIRRLFISGTTGVGFEKKRLNTLLKIEQRENNDILQWDFNDSFFNLTLKQILFLEWMERNCPHARFLLNGDDDVFVNTDNMVEYLLQLKDNDGRKHRFTGWVIRYVGPIREKWSKYYVPVQVYESVIPSLL